MLQEGVIDGKSTYVGSSQSDEANEASNEDVELHFAWLIGGWWLVVIEDGLKVRSDLIVRGEKKVLGTGKPRYLYHLSFGSDVILEMRDCALVLGGLRLTPQETKLICGVEVVSLCILGHSDELTARFSTAQVHSKWDKWCDYV